MNLIIKNVDLQRYLQLLNPIFHLTDMELHILSQFIMLKLEYGKTSDEYVFSNENKKIVAQRLGKSDIQFLNTYIMKLKNKRAIVKDEDKYKINSLILKSSNGSFPDEIRFILQWV